MFSPSTFKCTNAPGMPSRTSVMTIILGSNGRSQSEANHARKRNSQFENLFQLPWHGTVRIIQVADNNLIPAAAASSGSHGPDMSTVRVPKPVTRRPSADSATSLTPFGDVVRGAEACFSRARPSSDQRMQADIEDTSPVACSRILGPATSRENVFFAKRSKGGGASG